jgi:pimeloyl-ACP methyl ester carboxylesterase
MRPVESLSSRLKPAIVAVLASATAIAVASSPSAATDSWSHRLAPHRVAHGQLLFSEPIRSPVAHARMWWILYRSTDGTGKLTTVSGTVLVPARRPPKGGWPIISWAHGTVGIAPSCAPSLTASAPSSPIQQEVDQWVKRGFAIAQTDYVGLGTPSVEHPYLDGIAEGQNVIDIVRAARQVALSIGRRWLAAGHSQGGQAALFAGSEAKRWAPELRLTGVAAFAPASHIEQEVRAIASFTSPSPLSAYGALILDGAAASSNRIRLARIESGRARQLESQIAEKCLADLEQADSYGALAPADLVQPGADLQPLYRVLRAENPAVHIAVPVRVYQGTADTTVPESLTRQLVNELRGKHDTARYATCRGVNHVGIVKAAQRPATTWFVHRLKGPRRP